MAGSARPLGLNCAVTLALGFVIALAGPAAAQSPPSTAGWLVNTNGETSPLVVTEPAPPPPGLGGPGPSPSPRLPVRNLGEPALTNVISVETADGFTHIRTQHIPDYAVIFDPAILARLQSRPKFATDFPDGIKAAPGDTIRFGQDIGYSGQTCAAGHGRGYWPADTFCSDADVADIYLPETPVPATETCYTTLGPVGIFLNGVILFNWSDAQSYENADVWHNIAFTFEQYDFDICDGHAAGGIYHHHGYTPCLANQLKDDGSGHSPVWAYTADGYPIHGPWHAKGVRARSCWVRRDYAATSPTGCGAEDARTCQLVDNEDAGKGTAAASAAPDVGATALSLFSRNPLTLASGAYFEDYYYDPACTAAGGPALDSHNGHDHDGLGYHFHLTIDARGAPVFPYSFGPIYKGKLFPNAMTQCGDRPFSRPRRAARAEDPIGGDDAGWARVDPLMVAKRF